jgi:hypothetical protein
MRYLFRKIYYLLSTVKGYREMIIDGAQSVLGYFGFDRSIYGERRNTTPRKWRWFTRIKTAKRKRYPDRDGVNQTIYWLLLMLCAGCDLTSIKLKSIPNWR